MKYIIFLAFCLLLLNSCQSSKVNSTDFHKAKETRHGWTIFSGPRPTHIKAGDTASISRGKALYAKRCSHCHGPSGKGNGLSAKDFKIKPADLTKLSKVHKSSYIIFQISEGRDAGMPRWKDILTTQETWDLSHYIQTLIVK